jgi:hypothetical protein
MKKIVEEAVINQIKSAPDSPTAPLRKNFSISQGDDKDYRYSQDSGTLARARDAGSLSGSVLFFLNEIGDDLKARYPDVRIGTTSYQANTFKAPTNPFYYPHDNVEIVVTTPEADQLHALNDPRSYANGLDNGNDPIAVAQDGTITPVDFAGRPDNGAFRRFKNWYACTLNLSYWFYAGNFKENLPLPDFYASKGNMQTAAEYNVGCLYAQHNESETNRDLVELRSYMAARLSWNPYQSTEQLIREFTDMHYGAAAATVREYIKALRAYCNVDTINPLNGRYVVSHSLGTSVSFPKESASFSSLMKRYYDSAVGLVSQNQEILRRLQEDVFFYYYHEGLK